jgi:elongation factor Ts
MVNVEQIKELRDQTGVSVAECKKALEAAGGDLEKALISLRQASGATALKKASRQLGAGVISTYIHSNNAMGAMLELDCETDFVAKNEGFKQLAQDLAMQVAAFAPQNLEELLAQPFVKDPTQTIADLIKGGIQKFGEKIELIRFERFAAPGQ